MDLLRCGKHWLPLIMVCLASCTTGHSTVPAEPDLKAELPAISTLDGLRSANAAATYEFHCDLPLASESVSVLSGMAQLNSAPSAMSWAIYRFTPESSEISALEAEVFGSVWILVADFTAGHWQIVDRLTDGNHTLDLSDYGLLTSPADYFYCAAVSYGEPPAFAGNLLVSLKLNYNIELPDPHTYFVATPANGGSDSNPGTLAGPWASLQHAADTVAAGDTVLVGPGDYAGFMLETSGVTSHPVTFDGQGQARITSDNPTTPDGINLEDWGTGSIHHVVIRGFTVVGASRAGIRFSGSEDVHAHHIGIYDNVCDANGTWGIFCGFADDMVVSGNECSRSGSEHGIYLSNSCKRYTASHNILWGNNGCGIHNNGDLAAGGDGIMEHGYIEYNICYDNGLGGGSALNFDTVRHCYIRGNLAYNNHASGISIYSVSGLGSADNYVINNTIIQPADGRWCLNIQDDTSNTTVHNNILLNHHSFRGSIDTTSTCLASMSCDYNIVMDRLLIDDGATLTLGGWTTQTGQDAHSIIASPAELFVNAFSDDYHILAASPAHETGLMLGVEFSPMPLYDLDDQSRPLGMAMDIGADERP